jgi:hypothetical protein
MSNDIPTNWVDVLKNLDGITYPLRLIESLNTIRPPAKLVTKKKLHGVSANCTTLRPCINGRIEQSKVYGDCCDLISFLRDLIRSPIWNLSMFRAS